MTTEAANSFDKLAEGYDKSIRQRYLHYDQMVMALVEAIPFEPNRPIRVLDLGCGTGTLAKAIRNKFPESAITCLDCSESMLALARKKLSGSAPTSFLLGDFLSSDYRGPFEVVVSCMAFHMVTSDEDKKNIYRKIHACLVRGGTFYNADLRLGASPYLAQLFFKDMINQMRVGKVPEEEIQAHWLPDALTKDHPATLESHLRWLAEIGFFNLDVVWANNTLAVWGGSKR